MVKQSGAAMKVGTDGCLLGAWTPLKGASHVLDIGTGTGLVALMLAQRLQSYNTSFLIHAIDIEEGAVLQAKENVSMTPWKEHIFVFLQDILTYQSHLLYDLIVCNPPYFVNSLQCPDIDRTQARHTISLPFCELIRKVSDLLSDYGRFCVILPYKESSSFALLAAESGLFLKTQVNIHTTERKDVKRVLLEFSKYPVVPVTQNLILQHEGEYSDSFKSLMKDFYLKL